MFEDIDPVELLRRSRAGELWQLIDVREAWEVEVARIEATEQLPVRHIPMGEIPARFRELEPSQALAILCHSGGRSARVAGFLAEQGFARVANVRGGIDAWSGDADRSIPRY